MKQPSVFEKYAHEYDLMTNARQREGYHRKEVKAIISSCNPTSVLDAGCATGLTSCLFAREGVATVGLDRSRKMLVEAHKKFDGLDLPLTFRFGQFEKLPKNMHSRFDLVVCLANAIAGVGTMGNLRKTMANFASVLKPGGTLLIQMLNYAAVTENVMLPIKATENDGIVYIRYARRAGRKYGVHVVRLDMSQHPMQFEPFCSEFDNFTPAEVKAAMEKTGFGAIRRYADLYLKKKFARSSRDLVLVGKHKG